MALTFVTFRPDDVVVAFEVYEWCLNTIGPQGVEWDWTDVKEGYYTFQFNDEAKANWFKLTWLS